MSADSESIAHLRFFSKTSQVNLIFFLNHKNEDYGEINEEIVAVRKVTETVKDLFVHLRNKILKIISDKLILKDNESKSNVLVESKNTKVVFPDIDLKLSFYGKKKKKIEDNCELKEIECYKFLKFNILDYKYSVKINVPYFDKIVLPEIIYTGHNIQPLVFKGNFFNTKKNKSYWYKSKNKANWKEIGQVFNYCVQENDIGYYVKYMCIPINDNHQGLPFEVVSEQKVIKMPIVPKCPFETRHALTKISLKDNRFRVVSYNTLSSRYTQNQFAHCPAEYLAIDYRKILVYKELLGYNADIICLQEVDNRIYSFYFSSKFKALGYKPLYNKKGNKVPEGLAIFIKMERFEFGGSSLLVFNQDMKTNSILKDIQRILKNDPKVGEIFMYQVTSLQICRIKSRSTNDVIILANTHLYYHPDAANVRLLQAAVCLKYLKQMYDKELKTVNGEYKVSVIFCGDFNSLPDTDVYKLITTGTVEYESSTLENPCNTTLQHSFNFKSACSTTFFTNYTVDFKGCLDYIFYHNLDCTDHVPFYPEEILAENIAIPSSVFPSDHVALIANMQYK